MYSSSYSSLYQHTAPTAATNANANQYPPNGSVSPLAPFSGIPSQGGQDQSIEHSSVSSSSSTSHPGITSPLGNFPSTRNSTLLTSGTTGVGSYLPGSGSYSGPNDDLISNSTNSSAYQLVSGSSTNSNTTQHHSHPQSSTSNQSTLLTTSTAAPFGFTFPPLPQNEAISNLDQSSYNIFPPSSSNVTAPRRRGHKASSSSLASILIKPDLSTDSNRTARNPSPHRPSASITTATAGLSLGDNNDNTPSSYPSSHRRSSSTNSSPMKGNNTTTSSTAASTPSGSSSSLAASSAAAYRAHRRRRSKNHSIDRDSVIVSLYKQGKPLSEIARITGLDSEEAVRIQYEEVINRRVNWNSEDIDCLKDLLEAGERAKWKFISDELSRDRNKRIPATSCQKKFKEMFGVAEASSILGSSLCYVVFPDGWACLEGKPLDTSGTVTNTRPLQSVYENETLTQ